MATRPLDRALSALPDALTAGWFLVVWCAPLAFGGHGVRNALLVMLVEFIIVHASGFLGVTSLAVAERATRLKMLFGFAAFYLLFIAAWAWMFRAWWPFLAFGWLWVGKLVVAMDRRRPAEERQQRMMSGWALSVLFYLGGVFATLFLPLPRLGFATVDPAALDLPGSGEWVSHPQTVVAFGAIYFLMQAWSKWRDWKLPATAAPGAAAAGRRRD